MSRLRTVLTGACCVALALGLTGCGDSDDDPSPSGTGTGGRPLASSQYTTPLSGVCPDTVVVQTSWWPEIDYGATYQLLGPNPEIDEENFRVSGPLGATGVNIEIRSGGPAVGFESMSTLFETDDDILLGYLDLDEVVANSAEHPSVAVLAPYAKSPLMFFWGDESFGFDSLAAIGQRPDVTVLALDEAYLKVLLGEGVFQQSQIDTSYTGDLARFIAEDGSLVQIGFVTDEVYRLENDIEEWQRPVEYLLVGDDYPAYANTLAVRQDKLEANRECLDALVPIFQRAVVDYMADPTPANDLMIEITSSFDTGGYDLSPGLLADANDKQRELGLVANGADGVLGSFDTARIEGLIERLTPVLTESGTPPLPGVTPEDLVTTEFIDPTISLE
ncbi:hypothetical protein I6A84_02360 [Frankia sp. CNm7]|uniref:SsuA/THI5-like domain-containing protein n=1 Tax=Frankia nepalensis TaxID=1836974 RepID=A0A937RKJ4_9ACTN|nr:hypothetical protein [Frankia nepalensis]MBL7500975.1 hypothetical protein [Frankia nepalensis]MBL7512427.1 hypothetical protein [Frankia nepalensis]MBL7517000.1 hypothetical protein [Frankia nepalensis]MBL7631962.1 hypothetical protein [Frankia nepalensis]